mgnify:CR=1
MQVATPKIPVQHYLYEQEHNFSVPQQLQAPPLAIAVHEPLRELVTAETKKFAPSYLK